MELKACARCKQEKSVSEFGPDKRSKDGLKCYCRQCDRDIHRLRYPDIKDALRVERRNYYLQVRRQKLAERRAVGICARCDNAAIPGQTRCADHLAQAKARQPAYYRDRYWRLRDEALGAYGKQCACCGESEERFLTFDHINNDGAKHRREVFGGRNGGNMLEWLRRNKYPPGFQTLCYNCNCGRYRNGGICPHQKTQTEGV